MYSGNFELTIYFPDYKGICHIIANIGKIQVMSKPLFFGIVIGTLLLAGSCSGDENSNSTPVTSDPQTDNSLTTVSCEKSEIADFKSFLGLTYGMTQEEVTSTLGEPGLSEKSDDGTLNINWYNTDENSEIVVFVNNQSDQVETVGITFGDLEDKYLEQSFESTSALYGIQSCDSDLFGVMKSDITEKFGEPAKTQTDMDGDSMPFVIWDYWSDDKSVQVSFYFYSIQGERMTKMTVNWY